MTWTGPIYKANFGPRVCVGKVESSRRSSFGQPELQQRSVRRSKITSLLEHSPVSEHYFRPPRFRLPRSQTAVQGPPSEDGSQAWKIAASPEESRSFRGMISLVVCPIG